MSEKYDGIIISALFTETNVLSVMEYVCGYIYILRVAPTNCDPRAEGAMCN